MSPEEHRAEAERLLAAVETGLPRRSHEERMEKLARAAIHAALGDPREDGTR